MPETQALIKTGLFSGGIPITYTSRITSIEGE